MGMTIEDAIETLLDTRSYGTADIAKSVAIDTMRKYQKIKETINKWCADKTWEFDTSYLYEIMEIIEDGNDD